MICPNCNEMFQKDGTEIDGCLETVRNGIRVMPCPCCYGWGEHVDRSFTPETRRVCELCKGRRMVIEHITYEAVPEIKERGKA